MKYVIICILVSIITYWYWNDFFAYEEFNEVIDVTNNIRSIFKELDSDKNGFLNEDEFSNMKNSFTILQKNTYGTQTKYLIQEFPYFTIQFGEQVVNIEVDFKPLLLSSIAKNVSDIPKDEVDSMLGLLNWKTPYKERHPFGAKSFSSFLPPKRDVQAGFTWWIVESNSNKHSPPLSVQRYYPPQVPSNLLIFHALLSLFHPHPFLWTRFQPQGTVAILRAIDDNFYDIVFRIHAEYQLNKPPLHPFWFTPSQFQGRLIINKDSSVVKFFHMEVPDTKLNADMEWLNGPSEDSMEVDIGYIPRMSLISSAISVPMDDEKGANQKLSDIKWHTEISIEEALDSLELQFFPFKKVKYYNVLEAFLRAENESKLVHGIVFWSTVADLEEIIKVNSDSAASFFARICLDNYDFPVESIIFSPDGIVIHRINANALLGLATEQESFFEIGDPVEKNYHEFLENALLMSKAVKVNTEENQLL
ncbi:selenoprotein N [Nephila pilipes]|uniref:Selenoprotein N n=1 Tax=Nephila pilipes TaxID=299642 RepID=A0A8X6Q5V0_NEPPI|nr:selenoprotein N [Nephila pilipes]